MYTLTHVHIFMYIHMHVFARPFESVLAAGMQSTARVIRVGSRAAWSCRLPRWQTGWPIRAPVVETGVRQSNRGFASESGFFARTPMLGYGSYPQGTPSPEQRGWHQIGCVLSAARWAWSARAARSQNGCVRVQQCCWLDTCSTMFPLLEGVSPKKAGPCW